MALKSCPLWLLRMGWQERVRPLPVNEKCTNWIRLIRSYELDLALSVDVTG